MLLETFQYEFRGDDFLVELQEREVLYKGLKDFDTQGILESTLQRFVRKVPSRFPVDELKVRINKRLYDELGEYLKRLINNKGRAEENGDEAFKFRIRIYPGVLYEHLNRALSYIGKPR